MRKIILFNLVIVLFISCKQKEPVFRGNLFILADTLKKEFLVGNAVALEGIYDGYPSVYDSLILFESFKYPDHFFCYVFNLNSGKHIASLFHKGQGPDEFLDFFHLDQYIHENNEIKLWGYDALKGVIYLVNLTKSVSTNSTQYDTVISTKWSEKFNMPWSGVFCPDDKHLLIQSSVEYSYLDKKDYKLGMYYLYKSANLDEPEKIYRQHTEIPLERPVMGNEYFYSTDRLKPDNTKIAMGMRMLAQLNILNLKNDKLSGFRIENTPDYQNIIEIDEKGEMKKTYYMDLRVSDDHIFALYMNADRGNPWESDEVHIFDWDGNWLHKIILDKKAVQMAFDPVNKLLYVLTNTDEVYSYEVNKILRK
jgi:hypothetical protein